MKGGIIIKKIGLKRERKSVNLTNVTHDRVQLCASVNAATNQTFTQKAVNLPPHAYWLLFEHQLRPFGTV
jgi:hypothetical protein